MLHRHIRHQRAEVKNRLRRGSTSLSEVLQEAQADDAISGIRVLDLLESLPGIGEADARQIMNRLGIAESGLVRELSAGQRTALENEHGHPTRRRLLNKNPGDQREEEIKRAAAADVASMEEEDRKYFGKEAYGIEEWDDL